jgi:hypothetical protein
MRGVCVCVCVCLVCVCVFSVYVCVRACVCLVCRCVRARARVRQDYLIVKYCTSVTSVNLTLRNTMQEGIIHVDRLKEVTKPLSHH